jgi:NADPH:quinone reductase-like Zn-dependent oxidoreductase
VVVAEAAVWKLPEGFDLHAAAAVPVVYGTADLALRERAQLRKGACASVGCEQVRVCVRVGRAQLGKGVCVCVRLLMQPT